jgi:DDE superfamily endonuclease
MSAWCPGGGSGSRGKGWPGWRTATEPYASARRVFWVVDNGASHRNWAAATRMSDAYPNAVMVHLPVHASWLNQIEVVFSVIARKVLSPADFADSDAVAARLLAFQDRYNATATPFGWKFTCAGASMPAAPPG